MNFAAREKERNSLHTLFSLQSQSQAHAKNEDVKEFKAPAFFENADDLIYSGKVDTFVKYV